ncbi:MAG: hypothetical protein HY052_04990 [Proteobacteria bacterium]|nr:hypothetical protein [Pseudomonadota bacterium]
MEFFSWQSPQTWLLKPLSLKTSYIALPLKAAYALRCLLLGAKHDILYLDETGFAPSIRRTHGRARVGQRVYEEIPGN